MPASLDRPRRGRDEWKPEREGFVGTHVQRGRRPCGGRKRRHARRARRIAPLWTTMNAIKTLSKCVVNVRSSSPLNSVQP